MEAQRKRWGGGSRKRRRNRLLQLLLVWQILAQGMGRLRHLEDRLLPAWS
jgi:hypothetical protein